MFKNWDDRKFNRFFKVALLLVILIMAAAILLAGTSNRYHFIRSYLRCDSATGLAYNTQTQMRGDAPSPGFVFCATAILVVVLHLTVGLAIVLLVFGLLCFLFVTLRNKGES